MEQEKSGSPCKSAKQGEAGSKGIAEIPAADQTVVVKKLSKGNGAKGLTCSVSK
jgi:hypothetical protein